MILLRSIATRLRDLIGGAFPFLVEEPRVARYILLPESAGGFDIPSPTHPISDRHFWDISAPGVVPGWQPVIFFRTAYTGNPAFTVRLNTTRLVQHSASDLKLNSWHEIIPAGVLKPEKNELIFAVSGNGSVRFGDVVILYMSDKLTMKVPPVLTPV